MLAPFAPHFASELWSGFCSATNRISDSSEFQWDKDVLEQMWPQVDMKYALKVRVRVSRLVPSLNAVKPKGKIIYKLHLIIS